MSVNSYTDNQGGLPIKTCESLVVLERVKIFSSRQRTAYA